MNNKVLSKTKSFFKEYTILIPLIVIFIATTFATDAFLTADNLSNMIRVGSINGIMACGMTFVMIYGGFDLSVGMTMSTAGMVSVMFRPQLGVWGAVIAGILLGAAIGAIIGAILALVKGNSGTTFIVTLGAQQIIFALASVASNSHEFKSVNCPEFAFIGKGRLLGIPVPIIIFAVVAIISYIVLEHTSVGRQITLTGGNKEAARLGGIKTELLRVLVFSIAGFTAGLAGIVMSARTSTGSVRMGRGFEFDVITAVVIGGTSMTGGNGSIFKTILGVIMLAVITNSLTLLGVSPDWQNVIKGLIIILAVAMDVAKHKKEAK